MEDINPPAQLDQTTAGAGPEPAAAQQPSWFRCMTGSAIAAVLGYGGYALTHKIALNFAAHPFTSDNYVAVRISLAVRTLVVGSCTLATAVFGFAALGLFVLALQTALQQLRAGPTAD